MTSVNSLDSIGWDPSYQIGAAFLTTYLSCLLMTGGDYLLALLSSVLVLLVLPLVLERVPYLQRRLLFHSWYYKPDKPLDRPELHGLPGAQNRRIGPLGCWSVSKSDCGVVVVYCHGSSGSRANEYRVDLVRFLSQDLGFSVYSFDYRGYADSPGHSSEVNSVEDARSVLAVARREHPGARVYFYGHSMGTGVSCQAAYLEKLNGEPVDGVILEAPFLSIPEVVLKSPAARILNALYGGFLWRFSDLFRTRDVIGELENVLILFAEDDEVIPVNHATELHALCSGSSLLLTEKGGHNFLIRQEDVREEIKRYLLSGVGNNKAPNDTI